MKTAFEVLALDNKQIHQLKIHTYRKKRKDNYNPFTTRTISLTENSWSQWK